MALSVSQNFNNLGIDRATLNQVSQEILKRAAEKNSQYKTAENTNFFQPRDLGIDLYNNKVDTNTQKQIALNNSGLQIQLSQEAMNAIHTLNTKAAQNVQKNVEGKMTIAVNEITIQEQKNPTPKFNSLVSLGASKDKKGSNPFYHGELLMNNDQKEEKTEDKKLFI
uniref:hypothetical protein n=1 Tax=Candidatus Scatousia sp. TaxID=3085663 RepID=UPI0040251F7A